MSDEFEQAPPVRMVFDHSKIARFQERQSIENVIEKGIKNDIRILLRNQGFRGAVLLIYAGMDCMAYLGIPSKETEVRRRDFIAWASQYIRFPGSEQISGEELYGARCATLHTYGTESNVSRTTDARQVLYMERAQPDGAAYAPVRVHPEQKDVVMVSVMALAGAFFSGMDRYIPELFADFERADLARERLTQRVLHITMERGTLR